jgi:hypothetical protein
MQKCLLFLLLLPKTARAITIGLILHVVADFRECGGLTFLQGFGRAVSNSSQRQVYTATSSFRKPFFLKKTIGFLNPKSQEELGSRTPAASVKSDKPLKEIFTKSFITFRPNKEHN